ncbi:right-handed parallel beta-helix repeat-containing protein [Streptomyces scabiei]|uniref:right-handed parallel beta-helix repeat-containing protein n=1 Tax=Streptomyces scabiei TaxID=1930 RepID=UPI001B330A9F|nr:MULTISPECIES: right-handed parallel beta-helix repeat-containing protein [Streptomyces]MBP5890653.1 right-handed parallel beta-helix repeat-containing protein [Streptomyces sp. LBUM 1481]MBP5920784.1 right-handed parallel beta-helix repeat-containing protein [Streptomyces sp. LBUM 1483]MDX2538890.1 right-handed parallel beta-helix repeat-containing protein [Streptomyces scabiei]MDX2801867.1 right-handed parallel beta-helix repeat-containing protein [Streptomyces scabiei]MDX3295042.1 right-h
MPQYTYGGNPSAVLTTVTGDVVPDYPLIVRAAGTGAIITALFEEDGTTPIAQLRTNDAASDTPGSIRTFKVEGYGAIQYEYNGPSGQPVRFYEVGREVPTAALDGLNSKLDKAGGTITGDLDVTGTLDVGTLLVGGEPLDVGANWAEAGIILPAAVTGAAVQAALDEARDAGGGWVIIPPGNYDAGAGVLPLRIYDSTRLSMCDGAAIRRAGTGTMLLNGEASQAFGGYTGHGNIIIEGGVWDARADAYPTSAMAISIGHAENVTIRNTVIKDVCGYHAIEMNSTKRGRITDVTCLGYKDPDGTRDFSEAIQFDLAKGSSYFGGFGPYDDTPCVDIVVKDCHVGPSGTAGTTSWPRAVGSHSASPDKPHTGIVIENLYCDSLTQWAIGGYTWQDSRVSGLTLKSCGAGVRMRTLDSSSASHRTPAGAGSPSIAGSQALRNIVVEDVVMYGGGTYDAAVRIEGEDTGYVQGVTISGITVRDVGGTAVRLVDVEDYTVDHVVARGCGATAVSTLGTRRGRITAHVNGATGAGITVDSRSTPAATATDVTVAGCSITGTTANGVHIWDGADVVVDDCDLYALTGFGVQISTNTVRPVVRNCRTRDTTSAGINITSTITSAKRFGNTFGAVADASSGADTSPFDGGFGGLETALRPSGRYETTSRLRCGTTSTPTSGTLYLVPIWLPKGLVISNLAFVSGGTAAVTPTNYWFTLHNSSRVALARTADQLTAAWAANTIKSLAIAQTTAGAASSYTTTYSGLHYLGVMIKASTVCSLISEGAVPDVLASVAPGFGGTDTALTTPPTVTAGAFTAGAFGAGSGILVHGYAT